MPSGPCMTNFHRPCGLNSKTSKVLLKPSGPHQVASRSAWANAAKICAGVKGKRRLVVKTPSALGCEGMGFLGGWWREGCFRLRRVAAGVKATLAGGAFEASELDAKRAIDQASRLAAVV